MRELFDGPRVSSKHELGSTHHKYQITPKNLHPPKVQASIEGPHPADLNALPPHRSLQNLWIKTQDLCGSSVKMRGANRRWHNGTRALARWTAAPLPLCRQLLLLCSQLFTTYPRSSPRCKRWRGRRCCKARHMFCGSQVEKGRQEA